MSDIPDLPGPTRLRARERYAEAILSALWKLAEQDDRRMTADKDGVYFCGSLHIVVRELIPQAQQGEVVNILKSTGAVTNVSHGFWRLNRRHVFEDDEGNAIAADVPSYGHDSQRTVNDRNMRTLASRVDDLETQVENLTKVVMGLSEVRTQLVEEPKTVTGQAHVELVDDLLNMNE